MSIISNEHQSGSPFDSEQEPSEPGCICGRGVRCPLHGGPPQPGPEPMTTEHQPGSPGVDLDGIELPGVLSFLRENFVNDGAEGESVHRLCALAERMAAELRTLRARVAALEKLFDDAGQGNYNVLALIDHYQSEAMAESERRRVSEARVKELEVALHKAMNPEVTNAAPCPICRRATWRYAINDALGLEEPYMGDALERAVDRIRAEQARITDLESQLAAAREEQALEARVREVLGERFFQVRIGRYREFWLAEWREVVRGETLEHFANAETLPALLRAILEVEAKGG